MKGMNSPEDLRAKSLRLARERAEQDKITETKEGQSMAEVERLNLKLKDTKNKLRNINIDLKQPTLRDNRVILDKKENYERMVAELEAKIAEEIKKQMEVITNAAQIQ